MKHIFIAFRAKCVVDYCSDKIFDGSYTGYLFGNVAVIYWICSQYEVGSFHLHISYHICIQESVERRRKRLYSQFIHRQVNKHRTGIGRLTTFLLKISNYTI